MLIYLKLSEGKFTPRSELCSLVGYSEKKLGSKMQRKWKVTRNIKFFEEDIEQEVLNEFSGSGKIMEIEYNILEPSKT